MQAPADEAEQPRRRLVEEEGEGETKTASDESDKSAAEDELVASSSASSTTTTVADGDDDMSARGTALETASSTTTPTGHDDSAAQDMSASEAVALVTSLKVEKERLLAQVTTLTTAAADEREQRAREKSELEARVTKAEQERASFESQYKGLLNRVSHIRASLGDRLKADSDEIARQKTNIEYLEQKCKALSETITALQQEVITSSDEADKLSHELATLRQSSLAAQEQASREQTEAIAKDKRMQKQLQEAQRSAEDWQVIATEEKTMRSAATERAIELEEQLKSQKAMYEGAIAQSEQAVKITSGLRRAIEDLQEERKTELHDVVEKMQAQIDMLTEERARLTEEAEKFRNELETANQDLERMRPFEKEVKEKTLLIGKLRHEAVILNEHLTKALRVLKRGGPDENVDRQLITNLLLSFLSLPRSDTKRFEVLQLIAACLSWNEEQKTTAGLVRPGGGAATTTHTSLLSHLPTASAATSPVEMHGGPLSPG
ncbi:uncharacterized protein V1518DRAFT_409477 [Limtongia smithiae]|uniref:uncharacterized protein n=1 Tax=Limtongia smithiae TaxID=1125753 RepID=UPI0034CD2BDF